MVVRVCASHRGVFAVCAVVVLAATAGCRGGIEKVLTISGSLVGREGDIIRSQLGRFRRAHPDIDVELRATPDAADQRHQLYVQWLNARVSEPDVLQLDVVWTSEFAAAGWIAPLDAFRPPVHELFPAAVAAGQWNGAHYALPWFVDVGMLYWRTAHMARAPEHLEELVQISHRVRASGGPPYGFVWQGARYEGLVAVFVEHLAAYGGAIVDEAGRVAVDSEAAVRALTFMRDAIHQGGVVPAAVLTWQEEQTRFAFQNGQAAFMRNWPYAYALLEDAAESGVAGRFAVAPLPAGPGGTPTAALGGATLAINAFSDQPEQAYQLVEFLLQPEQMLERAGTTAQFPSRPELYERPELSRALRIPALEAKRIIEAAVLRPVSPVYSQMSGLLQVSLHRALTRQQEPRAALQDAAQAIRALLVRLRLNEP